MIVRMVVVVMLVIMGSAVVGWILTFDQVPTRFAEWVTSTIQNKYLVIFALNILMLLVGMPLEALSTSLWNTSLREVIRSRMSR